MSSLNSIASNSVGRPSIRQVAGQPHDADVRVDALDRTGGQTECGRRGKKRDDFSLLVVDHLLTGLQ